MDTYFVIGNPIAHSKSPQIHARFAELTGQQLSYERRLVALDGLPQALRDFQTQGVRGCNVTVPFKFQAFEAADQASARAELALAANTLIFEQGRVLADNTDGLGLVHDIEHNAGQSLAGRDVLLVGAGGAAAGVIGPLLLAGPRRLAVVNRTLDKAQALVQRHLAHPSLQQAWQTTALSAHALGQDIGRFDVVINATASSLAGAAVPVAASALQPNALVYDMMYGTAAQGFLDWARQHGARPRDGLGMLVEQAAEAFFLWRGVRPPSSQVLQEMQRAVGSAA